MQRGAREVADGGRVGYLEILQVVLVADGEGGQHRVVVAIDMGALSLQGAVVSRA